MPLPKALRFARRLWFDGTIQRIDLFLRPLAEELPGLVAEMQAQSSKIIRNARRGKQYKKHHTHTFTFPQNWKK